MLTEHGSSIKRMKFPRALAHKPRIRQAITQLKIFVLHQSVSSRSVEREIRQRAYLYRVVLIYRGRSFRLLVLCNINRYSRDI